jgi:polysaccharide biosynthesis/export protein
MACKHPHTLARLAATPAVLLLSAAIAAGQVSNYIVGPQDVLTILVYDQQDLGGKYAVEADGSFSFPLIGRIVAGGLTLRELEKELTTKLKDGFFKNPQVSVAVEQYRSQRVFVVGEVRNPGTYPLTGDMTLIEALARAGSTKEEASGEALIVRPRTQKGVEGPVLPDQEKDVEVIRVDVKELQSGKLSSNVRLRDNDTIFVPRAELVYVFGQVKSPGAYPLRQGTTVLQALSLAGGLTDRGAVGRINVVRLTDGKRSEIRVKLDDIVRAGDTILVPERFF